MKINFAAALIGIFMAGPMAAAAAAFPGYINYQGKLADPAGNPLTGTYSFRFRLYSQATGGTLLATDANYTGANSVSVTNGLYSVQIGSLTAGGLPESAFAAAETWLEIDVSPGANFAGSETLAPRERLAAAPFAFRAVNAEKLGTGVAIATFTSAGNLDLPYGIAAATGAFTGDLDVGGGVRLKQLTETYSALGAGTDINWALGRIHTVTLTANRTLTFSGAAAGQTIGLIITQSGAGSFTITWPTIKWPAATAPTLTTTSGKADIISVFYDGTSYWGSVGGQNY